MHNLFKPVWSVRAYLRRITIVSNANKHGSKDDLLYFGDLPFLFNVSAVIGWISSGGNFHLSNILVYDKIHVKLLTFPSALAVLCLMLISKC